MQNIFYSLRKEKHKENHSDEDLNYFLQKSFYLYFTFGVSNRRMFIVEMYGDVENIIY